MELKNNKGITGVDVAIAVSILTVFVALIATLFYNTANTSTKVERKAMATNLAIEIIEGMKVVGANDFSDLKAPTMEISEINELIGKINELNRTDIKIPNGYGVSITIEDYKNENTVKILTVEVQYLSEKNNMEKVDIQTLVKNRGF